MSTVCITQHNERIHDILKQPCQIVCRGPSCLYVSKYRPKILREERKAKECHRTFGYACVPLPNPCNFLRKHCRIVPPRPKIHKKKPKCALPCPKPCLPPCSVAKKEEKPDQTKAWEEGWKKGKGKRHPCPPKVEEKVEKKEKTIPCCKNFRCINKLNVIRSCPRHPVPKYADTRKGDTHLLCPSGMVPRFIHKQDYGQVPCYIRCCPSPCPKQMPAASVCQGLVDHTIGDCERAQLLEGLRKNWNELQKIYLSLPILTDTLPKRLRKERLERELQQLEHDIRTIERHKYIYVVNEKDF